MAISHLAQKPYTRISTGELQQSIARHCEARLILMDEPTAHFRRYGNQLKVLRFKDLSGGTARSCSPHNPDQVLLLTPKQPLSTTPVNSISEHGGTF